MRAYRLPPKPETAFYFAALILSDAGVVIIAEKLLTLVRLAGIKDIDPLWATLFERALEGKNAKDMLLKPTQPPSIDTLTMSTCFLLWTSDHRPPSISPSLKMVSIREEYTQVNMLTFRCLAVKLNGLAIEIRLQIFRAAFTNGSTAMTKIHRPRPVIIAIVSLPSSHPWRNRNPTRKSQKNPTYHTPSLSMD